MQPLIRLSTLLLALALAAVSQEAAFAEEGEGDPPETGDGERPSVALVLGGGGARGGAHLGVLQYLEANRIPVDRIVGTSGGAIMGGLYASGWSPEEIEELLADMDWDLALSDRQPRRSLPFRAKEADARYLFDLEVGLDWERIRLPEGLIEGRNLGFILERATLRSAGIEDFDELPIPFRAVAADLETGDRVDLGSGRLSRAIRASMSVPGVFSPVNIDEQLLMDGGLVSNLPISTARELDADVVIAVDVGARLHSREQLTDIFTITTHVTSLITYRSTQKELEDLRDDDVLLTPHLGDISSRDFPRTLEGAPAGYAAAERAASRLEALQVPEEAYDEWRRGQRRDLGEYGELVEIRFSGLEQVSRQRLEPLMDSRIGEPLDLEVLQQDLGRIYRLGEIERVDFALIEDDDETILEVQVEERDLGPHHFQLGLELFDDFTGSAHYDIRLGHLQPSLNALGAEWRSELQAGRTRAIRSEFYQPLRYDGALFVATPVSYESTVFDLFDSDGNRLSEFRARQARGGFDFGWAHGRHYEVRLGLWRGTQNSAVRIGGTDAEREDMDTGGARLLLRYDSLDDAEWPEDGSWLEGERRRNLGSLGADRVYTRDHLQFGRIWELGEHHLVSAGEWGEADAPLPLQESFEIGGPFSLAGLRQGELRGDRMLALRTAWFRSIGDAALPGVGRAYFGLGLDAGGAWGHGQGTSTADIEFGTSVFVGADTPLGPVVAGAGYAGTGGSGVFITLGRPFYNPGRSASPW